MTYQKAGYCCRCNDTPCYEVVSVWLEGERYPGEPKRFGAPIPGAYRVSMMLLDGKRIDPVICPTCAPLLTEDDYPAMWARILRSWKREIDLKPNDKVLADWAAQFENGILAEMGRILLTELQNG